jgi:hypothetical protein
MAASRLAPDRQTLYFDSNADNLVAGDSNRFTDIFATSAPITAANQFRFNSWESAAQESGGQVEVTVLRSGPATAPATVDFRTDPPRPARISRPRRGP